MYVLNIRFRIPTVDHHHWIPVLESLPGAFSSKGSTLNGADVIEFLLQEYRNQVEQDEVLRLSFPRGSADYIGRKLSEVVEYLLYEQSGIFREYTEGMIRSVYGRNIVMGWWASWYVRSMKVKGMHSSSVHSVEDCVRSVSDVLSFLSHWVDITDSMRLPMEVTSKLFSMFSVLLSIPLTAADPTLAPLSDLLGQSPQLTAIAKWCMQLNQGCKVYPGSFLRGDKRSTKTANKAWWEWLGWSGRKVEHDSTSSQDNNFRADKNHNLVFAMVSVGALFVFLASTSSNPPPSRTS